MKQGHSIEDCKHGDGNKENIFDNQLRLGEDRNLNKAPVQVYRPFQHPMIIDEKSDMVQNKWKEKIIDEVAYTAEKTGHSGSPITEQINDIVANSHIEETSGEEISTDSNVESVAQSDIVQGSKVPLPPNSRNMAELGVSP